MENKNQSKILNEIRRRGVFPVFSQSEGDYLLYSDGYRGCGTFIGGVFVVDSKDFKSYHILKVKLRGIPNISISYWRK